MTHGFVLGFSKNDSSELVHLLVMGKGYIHSVCYVEVSRIYILEYLTAAAVVHVMMMGSVEVVNGSIVYLVRYFWIGCTHVLSY